MGNKGKSIWENVIVIVLLGVIACFLAPIIINMYFTSQINSMSSNTTELLDDIAVIYGQYSISRDVNKPFTMSFNADGTYELYERTTKIASNQKLETGSFAPMGGSIILNEAAEPRASNIMYKNVLCNSQFNKPMECALKPGVIEKFRLNKNKETTE